MIWQNQKRERTFATANHSLGLHHGFFTPKMVNGTPNSLLKLFITRAHKETSREHRCNCILRRGLPTEPVTITMRG